MQGSHVLTNAEKAARGTLRKYRIVAPRKLRVVRRDIRDARRALKDLQYNFDQAGLEMKKDGGPFILVLVRDNTGAEQQIKKAHPGLKIQKDSLSGIRDLKKTLQLLLEEEERAKEQQSSDDSLSEFD